MKIIRFILPFLFARNWHDGAWEFSRARFILFLVCVFLLLLGFGIMYALHSPVTYFHSAV